MIEFVGVVTINQVNPSAKNYCLGWSSGPTTK